VISSFSLLGMLFVLVLREAFPPWRVYQVEYYRRLAEVTGDPSQARGPIKIRQIHLPEFHRVDRCITCHMGVDNPKMAGQPQPFAAHPDLGIPGFLKAHPFEEIGCTVCHHGQGPATTLAHAHGPVKHWEEPLLPKELVVGTCTACHGDVQSLPGAERLVRAWALFKEKGCIGCHTVHGEGMLVGPELDETFQKGPDQFDFRYVRGDQTVTNWVIDHFRDPQRVVPGYPALGIPESAMPNYHFTEEEITLLTALVLSFSSEKGREEFPIPARFKVPAKPRPKATYANAVEYGRALFQEFGCVGCHGPEGIGGVYNKNMDLGEEVPSLVYVAQGYSRQELKEIIRQGRFPGRADRHGPSPALWMPAWGEKLSDEQVEALVEYLLSLSPESTSS
jgi:mono/diheme cytochrome c family protein